MTNKIKFNITNYDFKVIKMNVFSKNNMSNIDYYILVDQNNYIHDYKIHFNNIEIRTSTTKSHEKVKRNNYSLLVRKQLINKLNLEHEFNDNSKKKDVFYFDSKQIKELKINKYIEKEVVFKNITFQNIEYILTGSNPSGQGNKNGYLKTIYNDKEYVFGFFMQVVNIIKKIEYTFSDISYKEIWNEWKENKIETYSFTSWINSSNLLKTYFNKFIFSNEKTQEWKKIKCDFEKEMLKNINNYIDLDKKISKLRNKQKDNVKNSFISIINMCNSYFEHIQIDNPEYAHIKPVWKIKQEFLESNDENILLEISDKYNCLPLPPDIHKGYDKHNYYWDDKGIINILNNKINDLERVLKFSKINNSYINEKVKKYLIDYKNILIEKNLIKK